jgi:hypothetical protein
LPSRSRRLAGWVGRNWARLHYARRVEPTWLEVNSLDVPVAGLPHELVGLRVTHLSDFHLKRFVDPNYIRQSVEFANASEPHVVALTGDFVHKGSRYVEAIAELLGELRATLGVFAVLGNHDHAVRNALGISLRPRLHLKVERALTQRGIRVLRNDSLVVQHNGSPFTIAGVDDLWSRSCNVSKTLAAVSPHLPAIVLAHNPRTIHHVKHHRCDLMLSGHTHGGQVQLPRLGPLLLRRSPFRSGLYEHEGRHLYVNKGVGHSIPLRFATRPEVAVLKLARGLPRTPVTW